MPDKQMAIQRAWRRGAGSERPIMVGIAGDSASGKTTLTKGLVDALGRYRITAICVDDYHRYDRVERKELPRREPESAAYIRPQRAYADIVVRFAPIEERGETPHDPLSAYVMLRPTIAHPDLSGVISEDTRKAAHLKLMRDEDGKPVDALHVHAYAERSLTDRVERALWHALQEPEPLPGGLGRIGPEGRSEPLAVVQLLLLYHLFQARGGGEARPPEPALRPPTFHEPPGREEQDPGRRHEMSGFRPAGHAEGA